MPVPAAAEPFSSRRETATVVAHGNSADRRRKPPELPANCLSDGLRNFCETLDEKGLRMSIIDFRGALRRAGASALALAAAVGLPERQSADLPRR